MKTLLIAAVVGATAIGGVAVAAQPPAPPPPTMPAPPMKMGADADRDGAISRDEFIAQAGRRFDRMDANKDGRLDQAERQAKRGQMGGKPGERGRGWRNQGMDDMPPPPAPSPTGNQ